MPGELNWMAVIAAVAGPITVLTIYGRQARKQAGEINQALLASQRRRPSTVELRPKRWYDFLGVAAFLALPFAQWFGYREYGALLGFFLPLGVFMSILIVGGMFFPRTVVTQPLEHREWMLFGAIFATALAVAFALPATGTILVFRAALADVLALMLVSYLERASSRWRQVSVHEPE